MHTKSELRRHFRSIRRTIDGRDVERWSADIARKLIQEIRISNFEGNLFLFAGTQGEPNLLPHLQFLRCHIALPLVGPSGLMNFYLWSPTEALRSGFAGIGEPNPSGLKLFPQNGDWIVVPALAIDGNNNRLGFGGGYYDRLLGTNRDKFARIYGAVLPPGISIDPLPVDPWDVRVDAVIVSG